MNIQFIITGLGLGGAEKQVTLLADTLASLSYNIEILVLTGKPVVLPQNPLVKVHLLHMNKTPWGFIEAIFALKKYIKDFKPQVVHAHMFHANIMARIAKVFADIPKLVCTAHSRNEGGRLRMLAYRLSDFLSDVNTNVSQEAVDSFIDQKAVAKNRIFSMNNGIDTNLFKPDTQKNIFRYKQDLNFAANDFLFLAVGRLTEAKDYPNLLEAFASLIKQIKKTNSLTERLQKKNIFLLIVGKGEEETSLKQLTKKLKIDDKVFFMGVKDDIPMIMNICDCFVLSSRWEGSPLVIAEAMACQKPAVATNCGGVKEVLAGNGFLVEKENSNALTKKMLEVLQLSKQKKERLGKNARNHIVKNYSIETVIQKWLTIYKT